MRFEILCERVTIEHKREALPNQGYLLRYGETGVIINCDRHFTLNDSPLVRVFIEDVNQTFEGGEGI